MEHQHEPHHCYSHATETRESSFTFRAVKMSRPPRPRTRLLDHQLVAPRRLHRYQRPRLRTMRAALCLLAAAAAAGSARAGPVPGMGLKETSFLGFGCYPRCEESDPLWQNWESSGSANVGRSSVVLTEDEQNQAGTFWSRQLYVAPEWELEMSFRVFGAGEVGADGFALWFTRDGKDEGSREAGDKGSHDAVDAFGHQNRWRGLGLFFDSYDNDNFAEHTVGVSGLKVGTKGAPN